MAWRRSKTGQIIWYINRTYRVLPTAFFVSPIAKPCFRAHWAGGGRLCRPRLALGRGGALRPRKGRRRRGESTMRKAIAGGASAKTSWSTPSTALAPGAATADRSPKRGRVPRSRLCEGGARPCASVPLPGSARCASPPRERSGPDRLPPRPRPRSMGGAGGPCRPLSISSAEGPRRCRGRRPGPARQSAHGFSRNRPTAQSTGRSPPAQAAARPKRQSRRSTDLRRR